MFSSLRRAHCQRWDEVADLRKRIRQVSIPRRVALLALCFLFFFYILISFLQSSTTPPLAHLCIEDRLKAWKTLEQDAHVSTSDAQIIFVGNGLFGVGGDGELRIRGETSRVLSVLTSFFPLITTRLSRYSSEASASVTDFRNGLLKKIQCFSLGGECACITTTVYAHRTRPHVLVQDVQTTNPTNEEVNVQFSKKEPKKWNTGEKVGETHSWWRVVEADGTNVLAAAVCSVVPDSVRVERKREENTRFTCLFDYETLSKEDNQDEKQQRISHAIVKGFADTLSVGAASLDEEHTTAWRRLEAVSFGISKSLAPDALNADSINATRYALLSNTRDPLLELASTEEQKKEASSLSQKRNMCYTGHSTLLVPSRLWKASSTVRELIDTVDVWLLTLEKRGCANLLKAGALGVAEAFALSLFACKFSGEHLEVDMDPGDLHREIAVDNLSFSADTKVSLAVRLDAENRPFFSLSSSSQMFVCDAACLNAPLALERTKLHVPVKVTRPATPILYLSKSRRHLEQLRGTIHVIEVLEAPAHEQELIALHKHGHRLGGLPVVFWVMLALLVLAFHLFLFKLLYSEWKKTDSTPYNYYLRQRYMRIH
ncbi:Uncharacterized protein Tcan_18600 [Toxocara canis]|uniref:Transmembrane protein n=2 Tax=Toxocara canis TaxID=6265 RepID=A0A0B2V3I8_TOXCA|nr:Uncharacterized protein Tcan_18600 [Toxocara canis]VDM46152.1 unnamed protein product [Toxocara canis]